MIGTCDPYRSEVLCQSNPHHNKKLRDWNHFFPSPGDRVVGVGQGGIGEGDPFRAESLRRAGWRVCRATTPDFPPPAPATSARAIPKDPQRRCPLTPPRFRLTRASILPKNCGTEFIFFLLQGFRLTAHVPVFYPPHPPRLCGRSYHLLSSFSFSKGSASQPMSTASTPPVRKIIPLLRQIRPRQMQPIFLVNENHLGTGEGEKKPRTSATHQ